MAKYHAITLSQSPKKGRDIKRDQSKSQKQAGFNAQQSIMETPPDILEEEIIDTEDDDIDINPEDVEYEEEDGEVNDWDDDETESDSDEQSEMYNFTAIFPGEPIAFEESPVIKPSYILNITQDRSGNNHCFFEPPAWFNSDSVKKDYKQYVENVTKFLNNVCHWFNSKQSFLEEPTTENYVESEAIFNGDPIITQKGFADRINEYLTKQEIKNKMGMTGPNLSRLLDKIWLVWEDKCMPIKTLFSDEFCLAWAIKGCLLNRKIVNWNINVTETSVKKIKDIKSKSFANMDNGERLIFLAAKTKVNLKTINLAILKKKNGAK